MMTVLYYQDFPIVWWPFLLVLITYLLSAKIGLVQTNGVC